MYSAWDDGLYDCGDGDNDVVNLRWLLYGDEEIWYDLGDENAGMKLILRFLSSE